ncbi:hypothetical protein F5146DRAFT_1012694 [Armillaria mellea]|nr:hypothetical protein F5146DRAFT_1012694 [Armillaria mellea]
MHDQLCAFLSCPQRPTRNQGDLSRWRGGHYHGRIVIIQPATTFGYVYYRNDRTIFTHHLLVGTSPELMDALTEDILHGELLSRPGLDDDRILRILNGQEEVPDKDVPDDASQRSTNSQASQIFLAEVPGCDQLEEDYNFAPVMRIGLVLSDVPEICDPSQLCGDLDLFQEIVEEYQLALYGSGVFPQPAPEMEITPFPDDYSDEVDSESETSGRSPEDLNAESPDSHPPDLSLADESDVSSNSPAPLPPRKGRWRLKSVFRHAFSTLVQIIKGHKFSAKL